MAKRFTSMVQLQKHMETACRKAIQKSCDRLLGTLQEIIEDEYYEQYTPERYKRTMSFWRSAMTSMLSNTCGQIFMNPDSMHYGDGWSGAKQIESAAQGLHGGWSFSGAVDHKYWNVFMDYCNQNAVKILKEELRAAGIQVK